jgi:hypothetical protein
MPPRSGATAGSTKENAPVEVLVGDKLRFAAEIGDFWEGQQQLRRVDLWAAGRWWTCDDNIAYLPQFCMSVQGSIRWLRSGCDLTQPSPDVDAAEAHRRLLAIDDGSREQFWFPRWGPTTDNVTAHVFRVGDRLVQQARKGYPVEAASWSGLGE